MRIATRTCALAVWLLLGTVGVLLAPPRLHAQGLTGDAVYEPPTTGPYPYSPPGPWLPGQPGFLGLGESYVDPIFGSTIRRLSDVFPGVGNSLIYNRNGFWNADGTLYAQNPRPDGDVDIIDTRTGALVRSGVPWSVSLDSSFDPVDPDVFYYPSGASLMQYSVSTGLTTTVKTFAGTLGSLGGSVDFIDRSGRFFLLNIGGTTQVWDKFQDVLYGGGIDFTIYDNVAGWAGISPDANYVIVGANFQHYSYAIDHDAKTLATTPVLFWSLCGDHADIVTTNDGKTYEIVFDCWDVEIQVYRVDVTIPQTADNIAKQRSDNVLLYGPLQQPDGGHFSCPRGGAYADWCFQSNESDDDDVGNPGLWRPYKQEIIMAQMVPPYTVQRLAHHRARNPNSRSYTVTARANANWDGTKVMFASNYGYDDALHEYSDIYAIELPNPPPVVTGVSPPDANVGAAGFTLTVHGSRFVHGSVVLWNGVSRATTFLDHTQLQIAVTAADIAAVGAASITVQSPSPGGGVSTARTFTVHLAQPTLVSPAGSIATATPTFTWNPVIGATQYLLWLNDGSGGRVRTWYSATQANCAGGPGICSLASPVAVQPGPAQWWIVAANDVSSGPWSNEMDFTVAGTPSPGQATLIGPTGSIANGTPTFTWNAVSGATQYLLWLDDSSGGRVRTWYSATQANCASGTGICSLPSPVALQTGAGRWWIVTANPSGNGPWSSETDFTVPGTPPPGRTTLIAPTGNIANGTPTFTWNAVSGATQYLLWLDDSSGGRVRASYSAAQANCASGTGICSLASPVTLQTGAGRWWIVTANASGNGPWSNEMDFTVAGTPPPGQATLIGPAGSIANGTPTFTWNAVSGATQYLLWLDDSSGGRVRTWYSATQANCASGIGACSLASPVTLNSGAGRWWIVTSSASGNGPWSAEKDFTVP